MIRFWERVNKDGPVPTHLPSLGPCWVWTGTTAKGYGYFRVNGRLTRVTRYSYELHYLESPRQLEVCHRCDNPSCVRPDHLFLGTHLDNMRDAASKGRLTGGRVRVAA